MLRAAEIKKHLRDVKAQQEEIEREATSGLNTEAIACPSTPKLSIWPYVQLIGVLRMSKSLSGTSSLQRVQSSVIKGPRRLSVFQQHRSARGSRNDGHAQVTSITDPGRCQDGEQLVLQCPSPSAAPEPD